MSWCFERNIYAAGRCKVRTENSDRQKRGLEMPEPNNGYASQESQGLVTKSPWTKSLILLLFALNSVISSVLFFLPWASLINFFIYIAQVQASANISHFNSYSLWFTQQSEHLCRFSAPLLKTLPSACCSDTPPLPALHSWLSSTLHMRTDSFSPNGQDSDHPIPSITSSIFLPYTNLPFIPHKVQPSTHFPPPRLPWFKVTFCAQDSKS